jgi:hypothetical protein
VRQVRRPTLLLRRHPWIAGLALLIVGHLVFVTSRSYGTAGDWAFIELRTADVFSGRSPLTGAWSRYGWNHPGPALFDLLALPYLLLGSSWQGLWIGAMLLNVAAIVAAVWLLSPHRRSLAIAVALAALWALAGGTPHLFTDPWNASVVVLPVLTMIAAVAAVRLDDRRGLGVAVVVFVLSAQAHAAYGILLLPLAAATLAVSVRRWPRRTAIWAGVGALLCLPIAVDTIAHWPGNLIRALRFTATSDEPARGVLEAVRVIGRATSLNTITHLRLPSFVSIVDRPPWGVVPFASIVALAGAWFVARRSAWRAEQVVIEAVGLLWLGGFVMVARTRGPLLIWLTGWLAAAAALTWTLVALVALRGLVCRRPAVTQRIVALGSVAALVASVGVATVDLSRSVGVGYPFQELHPTITQFARDAAPLIDGPMPIDLAGDTYVAGAVQSGLIVALEAAGEQPLGRPDQRLQLGPDRVAHDLDGTHLLVRVEPVAGAPEGGTEVSVVDPLSPAERAEADALVTVLSSVLTEAGLPDRLPLLDNDLAALATYEAPAEVTSRQASFDRLAELRRTGPRVVLYLMAPGSSPVTG